MDRCYWIEAFLNSMKNIPLCDFIEMCESSDYDIGIATVQVSDFMDAAQLWIDIKKSQAEMEAAK